MGTKKDTSKRETKRKEEDKSRGMIVVPYVKGTSDRIARVMKQYKIATAMKPHCTIRSQLVHPKDKREATSKTDIVYNIPCNNCDLSYIGESGRKLQTRIDEHKDEAEELSKQIMTRSARHSSISTVWKSATTDHVDRI